MVAPMDLEPLLTAISSSHWPVERPPTLWHVDTDQTPLLRVLGEICAYGVRRRFSALGVRHGFSKVVLNVKNLVVEPDPANRWVDPGEYVAITLKHPAPPEREVAWTPESEGTSPFAEWSLDLQAASVVLGYTRVLPEGGSITLLLRRLPDPGVG